MRSRLPLRRTASVNTPKGPSAMTRVPTGVEASSAVWSPSALTVMRSDRPSGAHPDRDDAGALVPDVGDAQPVAERVRHRHEDAEAEDDRERRDVERAPVIGCDGVQHELVAGRDLVEPCERDA